MYLQMNLLRMCGHKDIDTPEDERSFGFPFDREISFQLTDDLKLVNMYLPHSRKIESVSRKEVVHNCSPVKSPNHI